MNSVFSKEGLALLFNILHHCLLKGWLFSPRRSSSPSDLQEPEPDPPTIARHKIANPKVIINIGGVKHEVIFVGQV